LTAHGGRKTGECLILRAIPESRRSEKRSKTVGKRRENGFCWVFSVCCATRPNNTATTMCVAVLLSGNVGALFNTATIRVSGGVDVTRSISSHHAIV